MKPVTQPELRQLNCLIPNLLSTTRQHGVVELHKSVFCKVIGNGETVWQKKKFLGPVEIYLLDKVAAFF